MESLSQLQAVFLGMVQGITEFLPVSSSAHLILVSWAWNGKAIPLFLNVALHFGTLMSVVIYFHKDWLNIIKKCERHLTKKLPSFESSVLLPSLVLASIPAGILGLTSKSYIEEQFHSPQAIILPLIVVGLLLWFVDQKFEQKNSLSSLKISSAFAIGLAQSVALIPGVSRSGATLVAARMFSFKREDAAKFSFLLGTPAMFGAALLHTRDFIAHINEPCLYLGIMVSFLVGLVTIKFFLSFLKKFGFLSFAIYRVILAMFIFSIKL